MIFIFSTTENVPRLSNNIKWNSVPRCPAESITTPRCCVNRKGLGTTGLDYTVLYSKLVFAC
jgi:hypothetical protein